MSIQYRKRMTNAVPIIREGKPPITGFYIAFSFKGERDVMVRGRCPDEETVVDGEPTTRVDDNLYHYDADKESWHHISGFYDNGITHYLDFECSYSEERVGIDGGVETVRGGDLETPTLKVKCYKSTHSVKVVMTEPDCIDVIKQAIGEVLRNGNLTQLRDRFIAADETQKLKLLDLVPVNTIKVNAIRASGYELTNITTFSTTACLMYIGLTASMSMKSRKPLLTREEMLPVIVYRLLTNLGLTKTQEIVKRWRVKPNIPLNNKEDATKEALKQAVSAIYHNLKFNYILEEQNHGK